MRIKIGYSRNIWENSGQLVAATIRSEGSLLLSGVTGSGKTTLLWYLLYNLIDTLGSALCLEICDYKYEYTALYGSSRYHYELDGIAEAIDSFYASFKEARGSHGDGTQHILVIDEYMSFISLLDALARSDKAYKETYQRITMELSSILAMGRSVGYSLVCVVQQASAKLWNSSAERENFINKISMGNLSSIAARELFDSVDTSGIDFRQPIPIGCGFLSVQGEPLKELIVPRIRNPDTMQQQIRSYLDTPAHERP